MPCLGEGKGLQSFRPLTQGGEAAGRPLQQDPLHTGSNQVPVSSNCGGNCSDKNRRDQDTVTHPGTQAQHHHHPVVDEDGTRNQFKGLANLVSDVGIIVVLPKVVNIIHVTEGDLLDSSHEEAHEMALKAH